MSVGIQIFYPEYDKDGKFTTDGSGNVCLRVCNANPPATPVEVGRAQTPAISRITAPGANTEFSFTFPTGTKKFFLKKRGGPGDLRIAWVSGQAASGSNDFITLENLAVYTEEDLKIPAPGLTIYMEMSNITDPNVEISYWV